MTLDALWIALDILWMRLDMLWMRLDMLWIELDIPCLNANCFSTIHNGGKRAIYGAKVRYRSEKPCLNHKKQRKKKNNRDKYPNPKYPDLLEIKASQRQFPPPFEMRFSPLKAGSTLPVPYSVGRDFHYR
jgi:hypothetical protein